MNKEQIGSGSYKHGWWRLLLLLDTRVAVYFFGWWMIFGLVLAPCKESNGELNFFEIFAENR
jgi:hypothetical protein